MTDTNGEPIAWVHNSHRYCDDLSEEQQHGRPNKTKSAKLMRRKRANSSDLEDSAPTTAQKRPRTVKAAPVSAKTVRNAAVQPLSRSIISDSDEDSPPSNQSAGLSMSTLSIAGESGQPNALHALSTSSSTSSLSMSHIPSATSLHPSGAVPSTDSTVLQRWVDENPDFWSEQTGGMLDQISLLPLATGLPEGILPPAHDVYNVFSYAS